MSFSPISLRQVQHFVTLVRLQSYVRAAEELDLTQSALTRSIQALEERYQVKLLDRDRGGVRLTPAGEQVLADAEALLHQAESFVHKLAAPEDGTRGHVKFGYAPFVPAFLPGFLAAMVKDYPALNMRVEVKNTGALVERVIDGEMEMAVAGDSMLPADLPLNVAPLQDIRVALLARPEHPLASRRRVTMEMLRKYPLVHGIPDAENPDVQAPSVACDDFLTLFSIVRTTDALWPTPAYVHELAQRELIEIPLADSRFHDRMRLVVLTAKRRTLTAQARLVIDRLAQYAANLSQGSSTGR